MTDLILYTSPDGETRLDLRVDGHTVWLTQLEIAELFQTTKQNVSLHAKNILEEGELSPEATVKESLTVQIEGEREVKRSLQLYNLDLMLMFSDRPILEGAGAISSAKMKEIAHGRYEDFDAKRRMADAREADVEDLKMLEELERELTGMGGRK